MDGQDEHQELLDIGDGSEDGHEPAQERAQATESAALAGMDEDVAAEHDVADSGDSTGQGHNEEGSSDGGVEAATADLHDRPPPPAPKKPSVIVSAMVVRAMLQLSGLTCSRSSSSMPSVTGLSWSMRTGMVCSSS
jgi:hypothetical protein